MDARSAPSLGEYAFDGIVGPSHHYAGLSLGNLASTAHAGEQGNPRAAALQGLAKIRLVSSLGASRAVLPPHERPSLPFLRRLGFDGKDVDVLEAAYRFDPGLLSTASSASSMWTANAATVAPSPDTSDGLAHFTPANLSSMLHRSLEAPTTFRLLKRLFSDPTRFVVHEPLPTHPSFADEGAANHTRLCSSRGSVHLLGWGNAPGLEHRPSRYPARQTRAASEAIVRLHGLAPGKALLWQQSPLGIDGGAFHSDVLAVGAQSFLMLHESAFLESDDLLATLQAVLGDELSTVVASDAELPLADAVSAYPFNSELLPLPGGGLALLAPEESERSPAASRFLLRVLNSGGPVRQIVYVNVNDSMRNGGGPACLRLRVWLTEQERAAVSANVFWSSELDASLVAWVERNYRDRLSVPDLRDPALLDETRRALDELSQLLALGSIYDFQRP